MKLKQTICKMTLDAGFSRVRILSPFEPPENVSQPVWRRYGQVSPSLLVTALPYGNQPDGPPENISIEEENRAYIAPFARRNYYKEAVKRLQKLSRIFRCFYGGTKPDYRILCNSPIPEKPLALACGLGGLGRNSLVITPEAGSLVVIAAMTLPFPLDGSAPETDLPACGTCAACVNACPARAIRREGGIERKRCIQWYASGNEASVPRGIAEKWGRRLYGCTVCQDVCPYNQKTVKGAGTDEGILPAYVDARKLLAMTGEEIKALFKGSAMGFSWLKPEHIRRNAGLALGNFEHPQK
jgi:epoxyqueuosine reductase